MTHIHQPYIIKLLCKPHIAFNQTALKIIQILSSPNFNTNQSAYRHGCCMQTALLSLLDRILHAAHHRKAILLISLDLSAAFDTIDHWILLNRLSCSFGISGTLLSWLQSYLIGRSYSVLVRMLQWSLPAQLVYHRRRSSAPYFSQFTNLQFPPSLNHISSLSSSMQTTPNFTFLSRPQNYPVSSTLSHA